MGKRKKSTREKAPGGKKRTRYTLKANLFHRDVITPLERRWRQALQNKNYPEAGRLYEKIVEARKKHRLLLHRKEKVPLDSSLLH
ncbi:hypothetical protein [Staphylospora marina]|uniref:hypothetical protein n=1 Tax=Staphylospora marina TaxID=2490858 RepID=UPI000F5C0707|nr:hypothetical protein [Staphylospora marina]